jgi:hypothetical protein
VIIHDRCPQCPSRPDQATEHAQRRLLFQLCDEAGLGRPQRLELAEVLLNQDVASYRDLEAHHVERLLDALRGWSYIQHLRNS